MRPPASLRLLPLGLVAAAVGIGACTASPMTAGGSGGAGPTGTGGKGGLGGGGQMAGGGQSAPYGPDGLPLTTTACTWGATDPVARALCRPAPEITGLADLYRALGLETRWDQRLVAATTHSVGLAGRLVNALNPRVVVFRTFSAGTETLKADNIAALAFTRGEQAVELVGYDTVARDLNFYLLVFEQACTRAGCTPAELFGASVEDHWTGWKLYADRDLEDTQLDCLSCHRPEGQAAPKRFLMRELQNPWAHWSGFASFRPDELCPLNLEPPAIPGPFPSSEIASDDLRLVEQLDPGGRAAGVFAGVPLSELSAAASGHDLSSFISVASTAMGGSLDALGEFMRFPSMRILCEDSVGLTDAWNGYRTGMLTRGFPTPYHGLDVLDLSRRNEALADFPVYLARRVGADSFRIGAELMSDAAETAAGFVPSPNDDAVTILRRMCIRCHDGLTSSTLRRSRFDVERLDALTTDGAAAVWKRITASRSSPELMPPLRAGELPPWAIDRLKTFLRIP